ncbi:MAG: AraC family transcriptional regulator [Fibrobacter sp.]|jgi:AraC-like DNA-binding protein|nr:AraC family transcriptional regulator [Fibrobacter sp.]
MNFKYIRPSGILAEYVNYYWVLESDASEGQIWERVVPITNIELMFHYKCPFICQNKNETKFPQPRSFISGIKSDYTDVATSGDSGVITVYFYPFGACNFFRFPLQEIENTITNLHEIQSTGIAQVEEQLYLSRTLDERISIIEQYLLDCFRPVSFDDLKLIKEGLNLINQSKGQIDISSLSRDLCLTEKSLLRKFSSIIGKAPKQYSRIVRFQQIIRSLSVYGSRNLTQIAIDNGYFDQAHFIRDFKALSGYTPKEFLLHYPCNSDDSNP